MTRGGMRRSAALSAAWQIGIPLLLGLAALGLAEAAGMTARSALAVAGLITAGLLAAAFLVGFEARLRGMDERLAADLEKIDRSTELFGLIQRSVLDTELLADFVAAAGRAEYSVSPLLLGIAQREVERLTDFVRHLPVRGEIAYDGEDREWLLGLTRESRVSIDAVSLSTVDAGMRGFDGGLWTSDLGTRYLRLQREAIDRKVAIRRIFVIENADLARDETFLNITQKQQGLGIDVRMLDQQVIPEWLRPMIFDFIIFDGALGYESTTGAAFYSGGIGGTRPAIVRTRLATIPKRIEDLSSQFEQLWEAADPERRIGA
jgi:hypothetical protein